MRESVKVIYTSLRDLAIQLLPYSNEKAHIDGKGSFAFLIHPRSLKEVRLKFPFARYMPEKVLETFAKNMWPVVASNITVTLRSGTEEKEVSGYLIAHTLWPGYMLKHPEYTREKVHQAGVLARNLGANIVGLGALNSSITKAGSHFKVSDVGTTSGHSLTVAIAVEDVEFLIQEKGLPASCQIAIVGATGNIGKAITVFLADKYPSLILIAHHLEHLKALEQELYEKNKCANLTLSTDVLQANDADIVIVATCSDSLVLNTENLKVGAIVYDITEPTNVRCKNKDSRTYIKGCLVHVPGLKIPFRRWPLPEQTAFSCLAESILLSAEGWHGNFSVGEVDTEKIRYIQTLCKKYNFMSTLKTDTSLALKKEGN